MTGKSTLFWGVLLAGGALAYLAFDRKRAAASSPLGIGLMSGPDEEPESTVYVKDDIETLGRAIHSEIGQGTREQKIAVAWAVRNLAREMGKSIWELLCSPCGPERGTKRPASTRLPAREEDLVIAAEVLASPDSEDPTGGATHFVDPSAKKYEAIRKNWIRKYRWKPYRRIGKELEIWGP